MDTEKFIIDCGCGCSMLRIDVFDDEPQFKTVILSHHVSSFYSKNIFEIIKNRIKGAWFFLSGKGFHLYDVVIEGKDWDKFVEFVNKNK